ncbi:plasmid mobilization relaxosome protein MobC [Proteiniborus sp. MB09-C3]|uniref:plasmid mobilization protein n=1 Tax=Proteiniborus sp. MB09-C3 TaxID=3050072 RepID=UPI002554D09A|nr:plasmid mobilization relaxosome protein MobC [Proteiniborus sp. MB09-C3]WIV11168.1 plasmid mobilization relaxosome protein MobC [Proteiniborus sp. MB09-C3]
MIAIENRILKISFRVNEKENKRIEEKARKANMTVSEYLRYAALNKKIIVIEEFKELTKDLRGISRNLNQLTLLAHQGRISYINTDDMQNKISEIFERISLIM